MRKFKNAAAAVLSVAMIFSMAACGKGNESTGNSTGTDAVESSETSSASDATSSEDDYDWTITTEEVSEEEAYTVADGDTILDFDFDDGELEGFTTYMNGGDFELTNEDGRLLVNITKTGTVDYGCQAYHDGFELLQNCVYTISFDISCDIDRDIEWRLQLNGGDYHAYAGEVISIGSETQTISVDFTMEEASDPAPRLVFNMGYFDGMTEDEAHTVAIDNIKLTVKDASNVVAAESLPEANKVKVNQIGYEPDDTKYVVTCSVDDEKFKIVNVDTDEEVFIGEYADSFYDESMEDGVRVGDFSSLTTPGKYKVVSAPSGESYEFEIGDGLYDDVYKDVVLMLYNQRCGTELDESVSGDFAHEACHTGNAIVYGTSDTEGIDVTGGWHDAGDYGRYVVPGAKTVQDLLLAYEDYGADSDDIGIPESGNDVPDLLDEARYELEWMLKMQDAESGGVYHKVTGLVFPETVMPQDETAQLYLAPISYAATADFAAVMAKASTVYRQYDEEFADTCLEAAKKAYEYAEANYSDDSEGYTNPEEIVTGEYPDKKLKDERLWSAAELYIATGEEEYAKLAKEVLDADDYSTGLGWAAIGTYALYDLAKSDIAAADIKSVAADKLISHADSLVETCKSSAFGIDQSLSFVWGSNMRVANTGCELLMANRISPNEEYVTYAQRQRDYIFGVNGPTYCFVTGYGTVSPEHTHHRPSQTLETTLKGMLVGGADSSLEDPYALAVLSGKSPAYTYVDNEQSYSCNEVTIYWNSPLIYLMNGLE